MFFAKPDELEAQPWLPAHGHHQVQDVAGSDNVVQGTLGQTDEDGREKDEGCNPINTAALLAHVKS